MSLPARWMLGILACGSPILFAGSAPPLFRMLADIAAAGGTVAPETEALGNRYLIILGVAALAGFLALLLPASAVLTATLLGIRLTGQIESPFVEAVVDYVPAVIGTAAQIVFLVWFFRAYHNLHAPGLEDARMRTG